eukprot:CAMPEP_0170194412 /NCGR_PEP_ID=MMETSP0040_2-20121228/59199_1 /TAXON_ID=641309 /ORGANISM="Lotharella oceanica, Strain CCMP622" /LENGTH=240 /DNA_ID=CAMNT_0010443315 /DNA_START=73 /DNA_END=795 /DNA_ORIENTATION=-
MKSLSKLEFADAAKLHPAVTPKDVGDEQIAEESVLNVKETACAMSHWTMYQKFLQSDHQYAIVMEDDFTPTEFTKDLIEEHGQSALTDLISRIINDREEGSWDLINLGRCYDCCMAKCQSVKKTYEDVGASLITSPHPYCGTAYLINRKAAKAMSGNMPVIRETDDNMLYYGLEGELSYMSVTPRLFTQSRNRFGSALHDAPDDIECKECANQQCFAPGDMGADDYALEVGEWVGGNLGA